MGDSKRRALSPFSLYRQRSILPPVLPSPLPPPPILLPTERCWRQGTWPKSRRRAFVATEFVGIAISKPDNAHEHAALWSPGRSPSWPISSRPAPPCNVVTLADSLAEAYHALFLPAPPDSSVVVGQVVQKHKFVEQCCNLCRLATHLVIGRSGELRAFLRWPRSL